MWKNAEYARNYQRVYMRERRAWLKAHGLCTECKKEDARTMAGKPTCFACLEKRYGHAVTYREEEEPEVREEPGKIPKSEYGAHGLCVKCGRAAQFDGNLLCERCYENACRACWKGRKAQGPRAVRPPAARTEKAEAAYQYCLDHREEYLERWRAEYECSYENRASARH